MKIVLEVKHQGHVPSFKNCKRVVRNHLITRPDVKKWMERCIQSFESQLFCDTVINADETLMAPSLPSWIASSLPLDDSRQWMPEQHIYCEEVKKGEEGATIIIEQL
jgi:hypothetical protein